VIEITPRYTRISPAGFPVHCLFPPAPDRLFPGNYGESVEVCPPDVNLLDSALGATHKRDADLTARWQAARTVV
jgi:hypothetical protein